MTNEDQKELTIAVTFMILGFFLCVPVVIQSGKNMDIDKIKHDKVVEILWNKYEWKTKRLRVYTDIIYSNK